MALASGSFERFLKDLRRDLQPHQPRPRLGGIERGTDHPDDLVDVMKRDQEPFEDVGPLPRLAELILRPPPDHVHAVVDEQAEKVLQRQRLGPAVDQGQHDHAEGVLERRELEELVENDVRVLAPLDGHDDPDRLLAVAVVVDAHHAGHAPRIDQLGQLLEQRLLGELVGDLGEDDLRAAVLQLLDLVLGADDDLAPPGAIRLANAPAAADRAAGGEVGAGNDLQELVEVDLRVVDVGNRRVADLAQVVRRDTRRHPDGDPPRAVDQKVGELPGQDPGLLVLLVVVGLEVDRVELDVLEHLRGDRAQLRLGVPHGRRGEAMDRPEVPLPGDQQVAHVPPLRHPGQRGIDRVVAVRVIPLHRLADDPRALARRSAGRQPQVEHRHQDPPLRRLQAVADVGQRPADDHRHRVIEVALLELLLDLQRLRRQVAGRRRRGSAHSRSFNANDSAPGRRRHRTRARRARRVQGFNCTRTAPRTQTRASRSRPTGT